MQPSCQILDPEEDLGSLLTLLELLFAQSGQEGVSSTRVVEQEGHGAIEKVADARTNLFVVQHTMLKRNSNTSAHRMKKQVLLINDERQSRTGNGCGPGPEYRGSRRLSWDGGKGSFGISVTHHARDILTKSRDVDVSHT